LGCGGEQSSSDRRQWEAYLADVVVDAPGDDGQEGSTADASLAVNGVRGCGADCGSTDVFSLGYEPGVDNYLVVRWEGRRVVDGPGVDLVVFENAFEAGSGSPGERFMDQVIVCVSDDGDGWACFSHDYRAADESRYEADPELWSGFAGVEPVLLHCEENPVDPFDAEAAGGDRFDLQDLEPGPVREAVLERGFIFLKLITAPSRQNPDTGEPFPHAPISNGADIDGVYARYVAPQ
jgi:hypothetical protein